MKATFICPDESVVVVDVEPGVSLMQAATWNDVGGIIGDCGGSASCATCHVLVDPAFLGVVPLMTNNEDQMLGATVAPREVNSRLSCQLVMQDGMDGIVVRIADPQI